MVHVGALPGTPRQREPLDAIIARAVDEAEIYQRHGLHAVLIENMHDLPYLLGGVGPEIVAAMTAIGSAVRRVVTCPLGVQILATANREALAVALACGAAFVRVENFCFTHVADEGLLPAAEAGPLLRYRRMIGAEHVRILADIKKKHASHAITADITLAEAARTAEFLGADGLIVTGSTTGDPATPADVADVRRAVNDSPRRPLVCVGSGVTPTNLKEVWPNADVFIVGSAFKRGGVWDGPVESARVEQLMAAARAL